MHETCGVLELGRDNTVHGVLFYCTQFIKGQTLRLGTSSFLNRALACAVSGGILRGLGGPESSGQEQGTGQVCG